MRYSITSSYFRKNSEVCFAKRYFIYQTLDKLYTGSESGSLANFFYSIRDGFKYIIAGLGLVLFSNFNYAETLNFKYKILPEDIWSIGREGAEKIGTLQISSKGIGYVRAIFGSYGWNMCDKPGYIPVDIRISREYVQITENHNIKGCGIRFVIRKDGTGGYTEEFLDGEVIKKNTNRILTPEDSQAFIRWATALANSHSEWVFNESTDLKKEGQIGSIQEKIMSKGLASESKVTNISGSITGTQDSQFPETLNFKYKTFPENGWERDTEKISTLQLSKKGDGYARSVLGSFTWNSCEKGGYIPVEVRVLRDYVQVTENHNLQGCGIRFVIRRDGTGGYTEELLDGEAIKKNTKRILTPEDPQAFSRWVSALAKSHSDLAINDSVDLKRESLAGSIQNREAQRETITDDKFRKVVPWIIEATATKPNNLGEFIIQIQTFADTASLKLDGEEQGANKNGIYTVHRVARVGATSSINISATDVHGNTGVQTISVSRQVVDSRPTFARLNPATIKPQPARDAVAIIIGIQNYKLIPKAEYASQDAQDFYDYASRALGIKQENIKLLIDDEADVSGILTTFQEWLPLKVRKAKTDVYVFYSGHGLPSADGKSLYFLPVGTNKNLVAKTAISQREIVDALKAAQPRTVTMFIDSCYSGQIRTGETLLASARPVVLAVQETAFPSDFTVITASASDQIASSSPDLKHGIFSYYLMKGLEGEADENKDGTITVGKLQTYLAERVPRFAMTMSRKQEPQFTGDANRVLVAR